jgi:ABC-type Fe3+-siderophore transport system permease subunit
MRLMDKKVLSYGRGAAVGVFLGHIVFMISNGDNLHTIVTGAAISGLIGLCIVLIIERGFKWWGTKQPSP